MGRNPRYSPPGNKRHHGRHASPQPPARPPGGAVSEMGSWRKRTSHSSHVSSSSNGSAWISRMSKVKVPAAMDELIRIMRIDEASLEYTSVGNEIHLRGMWLSSTSNPNPNPNPNNNPNPWYIWESSMFSSKSSPHRRKNLESRG